MASPFRPHWNPVGWVSFWFARDAGRMLPCSVAEDHGHLFKSTTSLDIPPRVRNRCRWSDDQLKLKIRPEANLVSCLAFAPDNGCSHMFVAPSAVNAYCNPCPSGDQCKSPIAPGSCKSRMALPPVTEMTATLQPLDGTRPYCVCGYANNLPSGEAAKVPVN